MMKTRRRERVLVTGGAGYLGSVLVPHLLEAGYRVTVLDSFLYGQASLNHVCHHPGFEVVRGDVRVKDVLKPLVAGADVVIPLAGIVGAPRCDVDPFNATSTNKDAVNSLISLLSREQRVVMPTTNSGYGVGESGKLCTEESPLRPLSLYARDKVEVEARVLEHENSVSLRLATVFGMSPRMRLDLLVNDLVYRALREKSVVLFEADFRRCYIHIRDIARVFTHVLESFDTMKGQAFNVGLSEANLTKRELCEKIREHVPDFVFLEAPFARDPDQRDYLVSNEKIERTGFKPAVSLDDGIRELVKGFRMLNRSRYSNC